MNRRHRIGLIAAIAAIVLTGLLGACAGPPTAADQDAARSQQNTGNLITNQPVQAGKFSPTREQINGWVKTWEQTPGKLAYTYMFVNGQPIGYYVLKGPPVSYAQSATQSYKPECHDNAGCFLTPNPGQDGTWSNQGSGQFQYYGMDATTGRILEIWGTQATLLISDQPLRIAAPALGDTVIK